MQLLCKRQRSWLQLQSFFLDSRNNSGDENEEIKEEENSEEDEIKEEDNSDDERKEEYSDEGMNLMSYICKMSTVLWDWWCLNCVMAYLEKLSRISSNKRSLPIRNN